MKQKNSDSTIIKHFQNLLKALRSWCFNTWQHHSESPFSAKVFNVFLIATLLVTLAYLTTKIPSLNTEYSLRQFFPEKHKLLERDQRIKKTFQLNEKPSLYIILTAQEPVWLEQETLKKLQSLGQDLRRDPWVLDVTSIASIEGAFDQGKDLVIGLAFEKLKPAQWKDYISKNPLIRRQLVSEDLKKTLLVVDVEDKNVNPQQMYIGAQEVAAKVKAAFPELQVELGGPPAIQAELSHLLFIELKRFVVLSLVSFCFVLLLFFKNFMPLVLCLGSLAVCNLITIGIIAAIGVPFSLLLSTLPILVSITVISLLVHTLIGWGEKTHRLHHSDFLKRWRASVDVLRDLAQPNFLGSLTTAIGFMTLSLSDVPLIKQYGWVVAMSVMITWFVSQWILLAFMHFFRPQMRQWTLAKAEWIFGLSRYGLPVFSAILGFTLFFAFSGRTLNFSSRLFDDLPRNYQSRSTTDKLDREFGGTVNYDLMLKSDVSEFWKQPAHLKKLSETSGRIRHLPGVGASMSVNDFLGDKIPNTKQGVAETLFLFSMSENNPMRYFITEDGKSLRLAVRLRDVPTKEMERLKAKVRNQIVASFPDIRVEDSGIAMTVHAINQQVAHDLIFGFWQSLAIISTILIFIFKSLRWALVAALPNLVPPAVLLGFLGLLETPVKPGLALIFSIALGLAFNNTVYLLGRIKKIMKDKSLTILPLKKAFYVEANPCLYATVIVFSGFVVFLASEFDLNKTFGAYMLLSIFAGAIGDLMFLPLLLKFFPELLNPATKTSLQRLPAKLAWIGKMKKNFFSKNTGVLLVVTLLPAFGPRPAIAEQKAAKKAAAIPEVGDDAQHILKKSQAQLESRDDQATVVMTIVEADGSTKNRKMKIKTLKKDGFRALVRIESPADLKGLGFLAEIKNGQENQWLYSPSTKQVRRVVGANKKGGLLGSEIAAEDLDSAAVQSASVKYVKKEEDNHILEVVPKAGTSPYDKVVMAISAIDFLPLKVDYYETGKVKKTVSFSDYVKFGNVFRAKKLQVKNLNNNRSTILELTDITVNGGLTKDDFSVQSLKQE